MVSASIESDAAYMDRMEVFYDEFLLDNQIITSKQIWLISF